LLQFARAGTAPRRPREAVRVNRKSVIPAGAMSVKILEIGFEEAARWSVPDMDVAGAAGATGTARRPSWPGSMAWLRCSPCRRLARIPSWIYRSWRDEIMLERSKCFVPKAADFLPDPANGRQLGSFEAPPYYWALPRSFDEKQAVAGMNIPAADREHT